MKLIATRELLQQGAVNTPKPTDAPTSVPTTVTEKPTATPTPTVSVKPTATPTPAPKYCTITFNPQRNINNKDITLIQGKKYTITLSLFNDKLSAPVKIVQNGREIYSRGQVDNSQIKYLTFEYSVPEQDSITWNITDDWWAISKISASAKSGINAGRAIAANGRSDVSFTPAEEVGSVQSGLESVSSIIGDKEYTVVDTQWLSKTNNWKYKWDNLPKHQYDADGKIYTLTYYIVETIATGAATNSYSGNGTGKVTVTNTEEETSATVTKAWDDSENQDGVRPDELTVELKNGNTVVATVTLNAANNWTATVDHLQKYSNGQKITYTWNEKDLPAGYTFNGDATNGTITTLTNTHTTAKINVSVEKKWNDKGNQDGIRPSSISVQLQAGGQNVGNPVMLDGSNNWHYEWTGLEKNKNGQLIAYSVDETAVPGGYTKNVTFQKDDDGNYSYTITNTHEAEKVKVSVEKIWDDKNNQDGKQPDSVTVQLKDGSTNVGDPVTLNKDNQWSHEWTGLDKNKNGTPIIYSVDEIEVPAGYTKNVSFEKDSAGNYS